MPSIVGVRTFRWLTPAAPAAIAVVECPPVAGLLSRPLPEPGRARVAWLREPAGGQVDEVVVVRTGETRLEIMTHGGAGVRAAVTRALVAHGLREADSGTDPSDARWCALAQAAHPAAVAWLLAHPNEDPPFRSDYLARPPLVLITGAANAGKSTLLNAWCGRQRALVSDQPGTTRDLVTTEALRLGWRLRLCDSAGLRSGGDALETAGQELVAAARWRADLVLFLDAPDASAPAQEGDLVVLGKADLRPAGPGLRWSDRGADGRDPGRLLDAVVRAVLDRLGLPPR